MLAATTLVLGLTATSPIPVPRPALVGDTPSARSVETPVSTDGLVVPPPRDFDERTVFEIILQDLEQLGEAQANADAAETPSNSSDNGKVAATEPAVRVPIPPVRPAVLARRASPESRATGSVCGDPRLTGTMIAPVRGKIRACGIATPVRLTAVNGIKLTTAATVRCETARTFADWLTDAADPQARQDLGAPISSVWVMASYSCRTRNHRKGARLSEHSFGRAIDVGGFVLANGRKVTVLDGWNKGTPGRFLRSIWRRACGPFKTVLGPESDRHHRNHFHFDVADRRSTFCR